MNTPEARRNALEWLFVALPFCLLILWRVGWVLHLTSHPANPAHPVDITQLVEVLLYFGLCAIIFWWYYSAQWKAKLLKSLPLDISFVPLSLQDYSQLDFSALLRSTADLESAGFTQAGDYEMQAFYGRNVAKRPPKMMRVFLHHEHRCLAVIAPSLAPSQNGAALTAIQCTILSYLSRNSGPSNDPVTPFINSTHQNAGHKQKQKVPRSSETWSLSTLNYQPPAITYILRQPRSLWVCRENNSSAELLASHLSWREQVAATRKLTIVSNLGAETYFAHQKQANTKRRQVLRRKNMLIALIELKWIAPHLQKWED